MNVARHYRSRIIILFFSLFLCGLLIACGSNKENNENTKTEETVAPIQKVQPTDSIAKPKDSVDVIDTTDERTDQNPPLRTGN